MVLQCNELVEVVRQQAVTTSLKVAEHFGKMHKNVIQQIRILSAEISANPPIEGYDPQFIAKTYLDVQGKTMPYFEMNRDGFTELVGNMNGAKAREWKRKYFAAFNAMERQIQEFERERSSAQWLEIRGSTKANCRKLGDVIRDIFIPYATAQGSQHPEQLYQVYHKMINKAACVPANNRDNLSITQLHIIDQMEDMAAATIRGGVGSGIHYKEINANARQTIDGFARVAMVAERFALNGAAAVAH